MPYVGTEREKQLIADPKVANCAGDYNALFSIAYLTAYIQHPKYERIELIRRSSMQPALIPEVAEVEAVLTGQGVDLFTRIIARDLAFHEFYARIGRQHENLAKRKNGDLQKYKEAEAVLHQKALELVQDMQVVTKEQPNEGN